MKNKQEMPWKTAFGINSRALSLLYREYPQMVISRIFLAVWGSLSPYAVIYLSALIIEELSADRNPETLKALVLVTLAASAVIALVSALLTKWNNAQSAGIFFKCEQVFSKKLLDMDFVSVDDTKTHELLSQIRQNYNGGGWGLARVLSDYESLLSSVFTVFGGITLTVSLFTCRVPEAAGGYAVLNNPLFVLLVVAAMLAVTLTAPSLSNRANSYWAKNVGIHNLGNRLFGHFGFLGYEKEIATDVRIYRQDLLCGKYASNKESAFHANGIFAKYAKGPMGLLQASSAAVSVVFTGIAFLFVCLKAWAGAFGVGMVTQYISSITRVSGGVSQLISTAGTMKNNAAFLGQVFAFLDMPNNMQQGSFTVEKKRDHEVELRNVSFKYPGAETFALSGVSMKFNIGRRLAVVGMNGSGKTTFIKLLCRLYDPTEGEILLNGIDIRKYSYLDYMMLFSVVFQDFKLFSFTLGENVASGSRVNEGLAVDCLQMAGFGERLSEMEKGIHTYLYKDCEEDGINVSGGEAQKIAIARAIYKDAPFVILDEPTAALDPIAEAEIYGRFDEIAGDRTAIYISHRLSSCQFCDEIAVFHEGAVIQQGTHADLIADAEGKYAELWNAQAQYYTA